MSFFGGYLCLECTLQNPHESPHPNGSYGLFWQGVDYRMQMRFLGDFEGDILYQDRLWSSIQLSLVFFREY